MRELCRRGFAGLFAAVLTVALAGCELTNNKWIRVRRDKNPDVARIRLKLADYRGPKERVEKFLRSYQNKSWADMENSLGPRADLRQMKDAITADFTTYGYLETEVWAEEPVFNSDQDRARVSVRFAVEKIHAQSGSIVKVRGSGVFVMTESGGWDIIGYIGDPFWAEGKR